MRRRSFVALVVVAAALGGLALGEKLWPAPAPPAPPAGVEGKVTIAVRETARTEPSTATLDATRSLKIVVGDAVVLTMTSGGEVALAGANVTLEGSEIAPRGASVKKIQPAVGSVVELANVLTAYEALREASSEQKAAKIRSVIGAWSDLLEHGGGLVEGLLRECATKRIVGGAVGVFAFIGSTLDMIEFEGQLVDAMGEYDYGKAVGRGLEVAGAATSAVGGAMVLAGAIYGGSLGPVGALVGVIGGVLIAVGFVVAAWFAHNANEKFANRCFLGNESARDPKDTEWSEIRLPTSKVKDEARTMLKPTSESEVVSLDESACKPMQEATR